jgi:excisionase family DNA binding protein
VKLSLSEAANVLGKSERQVRYLIKTGHLAAVRDGGRWRIDSADLPLSEAQRASLASRLEVARQAFERGLAPVAKTTGEKGEEAPKDSRRQYSVVDLTAFQKGQAVYRDLRQALGAQSLAGRRFHAALTLLARGCHSFQPAEKAARFTEARDQAAAAVAELLLQEDSAEAARALAERIEQELIPKIAGLVATHEKRSRGARFERFGSIPVRGGR